MGVNKINGIAVASIAKINGKTVDSYTKINGQTISSTPAVHSPMWVAVAGTKLAYSTDADASTWTEISVSNISAFKDLTFGKNSSGVDTWYGCTKVDAKGVMHSTDPTDADSWTIVDPDGTGGGTAIEYGASDTIVLGREHENHAMRYSTDYGVSWTDATITSTGNAPKACDSIATNGDGLWMAGMGTLGVILKSYDDGVNWYKSADLGSDKHIGMEYANGVWVATEEGETINICTSVAESNSTDTWTQINPPTWNRPGDAITHVTGNTWMIGGTRRNMYKSTDNAATWTAVTSLTNHAATSAQTNNNAYSMASDGTNVVAAGRNGYINVSTDLGGTWRTAHTMSSNTHIVSVEYNKVKPF